MNLPGIINMLSKDTYQNLLNLRVKPRNTSTFAFTVQYNESAFGFINRLACRYGEWCYYDGLDLVFGHKEQPQVSLYYGSNLLNFDFAMQAAPVHASYTAAGYMGNTHLPLSCTSSTTKAPSLHKSMRWQN